MATRKLPYAIPGEHLCPTGCKLGSIFPDMPESHNEKRRKRRDFAMSFTQAKSWKKKKQNSIFVVNHRRSAKHDLFQELRIGIDGASAQTLIADLSSGIARRIVL